MRVYISGGITGVPDYIERFARAEQHLKSLGHKVFNPTCIPDIFEYTQFMQIDLIALSCCEAIYMLNGWEKSNGAQLEYMEAKRMGLQIIRESSINDEYKSFKK